MQRSQLEAILDTKVVQLKRVSGGSTNIVECADTICGKRYLVKTQPQAVDAFQCEAEGLDELTMAGVIRVPKVIWYDAECIVMEWIPTGLRRPHTFAEFGQKLAKLHRFTSEYWGFKKDNYCGLSLQKNTPAMNSKSTRWVDFYFDYRLEFQLKLAEQKGLVDKDLRREYTLLSEARDRIFPEDHAIPSLLHGDLWSGNYLITDEGEPVLIDPAVYYGHREADLAMTKLFGGFPEEFYHSYNQEYPLAKDWKTRLHFYQLYHLLNHLNLFGGGYYGQVFAAIQQTLRIFCAKGC